MPWQEWQDTVLPNVEQCVMHWNLWVSRQSVCWLIPAYTKQSGGNGMRTETAKAPDCESIRRQCEHDARSSSLPPFWRSYCPFRAGFAPTVPHAAFGAAWKMGCRADEMQTRFASLRPA